MTALQTQNDPAAIAVAPGHGSNIPSEETKMNKAVDTTAPAEAPVSLMETIRLYKRGLAEFNFRSFDVHDDEWNDLVPLTYGPHYDALSSWDKPAASAEEAMEALRITLIDDGGIYGCEAACRCMINAACGYLKGVAA